MKSEFGRAVPLFAKAGLSIEKLSNIPAIIKYYKPVKTYNNQLRMSKKCHQILVMKQLFNKGYSIFTVTILIFFKLAINSETQIDKL